MQLEDSELKDMLNRWNTGQTITDEEINILFNQTLLSSSYQITDKGNDLLYGEDRLSGEGNCQFD